MQYFKQCIEIISVSTIFFLLSSSEQYQANSFVMSPTRCSVKNMIPNIIYQKNGDYSISELFMSRDEKNQSSEYRLESERLKKLAQAIRDSIPEEKLMDEDKRSDDALKGNGIIDTEGADNDDDDKVGYRLYVDIGREPGTWMDPRWGASGKRIEFSLDIEFCKKSVIDDTDIQKRMDAARSNPGLLSSGPKSSKNSKTYTLESSKAARLRNGFDHMKCFGGAYRLDDDVNTRGSRIQQSTLRFFIDVQGKEDSAYGDISIPPGSLYFSLPCFGKKLTQLSSKEGIVTVRQVGWNTGWRREESRIVGTFRALPIDQAQKRDRF